MNYRSLDSLMDAKDHFNNQTNPRKLMSGIISISLAIVSIVIFSCVKYEDEKTFKGSGTKNDPYKIGTVEELARFAELVNNGNLLYYDKFYKLTKNINLDIAPYNSGNGWVPIGYDVYDYPFRGSFDGNGKTISGLFINNSEHGCLGLFGCFNGSEIKNLGVEGTIKGRSIIGGVAGCILNGGSIINCYSNVTVIGEENVGGITGYLSGSIVNCYSVGEINGSRYVGGIAGSMGADNNFKVINCYVTGAVFGGFVVGGVIGRIHSNSNIITGCAALNPSVMHPLRSDSFLGRIIGNNYGGTAEMVSNNVAWENMVCPGLPSNIYLSSNGDDISTTQAKMQSTYTNLGWKFNNNADNPWRWGDGSYTLPVLYWQTNNPSMPSHLQ